MLHWILSILASVLKTNKQKKPPLQFLIKKNKATSFQLSRTSGYASIDSEAID